MILGTRVAIAVLTVAVEVTVASYGFSRRRASARDRPPGTGEPPPLVYGHDANSSAVHEVEQDLRDVHIVRTRFDEQHGLIRILRSARRDRAPRAARPDDHDVERPSPGIGTP